MLYEEKNPQPPQNKWILLFPLIFQILAIIFFFCCSGSVRTSKFFLVLFFGATYFGFIVGGMVSGDI